MKNKVILLVSPEGSEKTATAVKLALRRVDVYYEPLDGDRFDIREMYSAIKYIIFDGFSQNVSYHRRLLNELGHRHDGKTCIFLSNYVSGRKAMDLLPDEGVYMCTKKASKLLYTLYAGVRSTASALHNALPAGLAYRSGRQGVSIDTRSRFVGTPGKARPPTRR